MEDREQKVREIFNEAVEMPPAEWAGILERRTDDPVVRARVQTLLDHHVKSGDFLSRPATETFPDVAGTMGGQIAEFRIVREIGRGGMGAVYLAEDTILKRAVALKVLPPQFDAEARAGDRFRKEAQAVARLSHPRIVKVFRYGEERSYSYIAMEYVEGDTLRGKFLPRSGAASPPMTSDAETQTISRLVSEVADALDHAHQQGVIHRDIKPSNILIDQDHHARLTDFGVAKIVTEETLSKGTDISGSYPYMSPEQARVRAIEIDHRSDIFSLGVVLYELLTHIRPFDGATPQEIIRALSDREATAIGKIVPRIPEDLAIICHKAIEKSPEDRYQTAAHMAADLRCFLAGRPILARKPSVARLAKAWLFQHRLGTLVACILVLAGGLAFTSWRIQKTRESSQAWLAIEATPRACRAMIQVYETSQAQVSRQVRQLGSVPVKAFDLAPGQYRVTIVDASSPSTFAEFNVILKDVGVANSTTIVIADSTRAPGEIRTQNPGRVLIGYLRSQEDVAKDEMVQIPGGSYQLGTSALAHPLLRGTHVVEDFLIDNTKVSNREFKMFLDATGTSLPNFWKSQGYPAASPDLPVTGVTLEEAEAYARWRGKRLPTLIEWQCASRGPSADLYPWGNAPPPSKVMPTQKDLEMFQSANAKVQFDLYLARAIPISSADEQRKTERPAQMFSNGRELCADVDATGQSHVVTGRCWSDLAADMTLETIRFGPLKFPTLQNGFRCAKSVVAPSAPSR